MESSFFQILSLTGLYWALTISLHKTALCDKFSVAFAQPIGMMIN